MLFSVWICLTFGLLIGSQLRTKRAVYNLFTPSVSDMKNIKILVTVKCVKYVNHVPSYSSLLNTPFIPQRTMFSL